MSALEQALGGPAIEAATPECPAAAAPQLAAVSLTTRDPGSYSRLIVPTFTGEAAWGLRHDVSAVPG